VRLAGLARERGPALFTAQYRAGNLAHAHC
jgi:hypothetical protein